MVSAKTMEVTKFAILISVIFSSVIIICVLRILNWAWLKPKRLERYLREQGFKGNSYRFLFGDLKEGDAIFKEAMSKPISISDDTTRRILPLALNSINKHGKDSFVWFGPTPVLNITNPEHIKEILTKCYEFEKPHHKGVDLLITGTLLHEGDKWAKHRKIISPAFHIEKLKRKIPAINLSCTEMLNKWESLVNESQGSREINVWPYLETMTGDVISRTAFGSSYEDGRRIFQLQKEQQQLVLSLLEKVFIPGWRFVPTKNNRRIREIYREVHGLLKDMIRKRETAIKVGEAHNNDDLLGILLESNLKEISENENKKNVGMTIEDVIEECKLFYFAGQETTSVLLVWSMVLLSQHSDWQDRAREEVLNVFGDKNPDFDGLVHLKVVTMILYEVLRLYPPASVLNRVVHKKTKVGNLSLPAGVQLSLPTLLVHHDPELWGEDAKEFKPERFAEGILKATKGRVSYFPFGWGPRICFGQNFSMIEAKLALSLILQRFTFELSRSYTHAPCMIITLQPQCGAHLVLHKR